MYAEIHDGPRRFVKSKHSSKPVKTKPRPSQRILVRDKLPTHTPQGTKSQDGNKAAASLAKAKRSNSAKWLYNSTTYKEGDEDAGGGSTGGGSGGLGASKGVLPGGGTASGGNSGGGSGSGESSGGGSGGLGGRGSGEDLGGGLSGGLGSGEGFGVREFHLYDDPDVVEEVNNVTQWLANIKW